MAGVTKPKSGEDIPSTDHVVRYCSPLCVKDGKITSSAFRLRNEDYFSVNWLEYFSGYKTPKERLKALQDSIKTLTIKKSGKFAKISVEHAKKAVSGLRIVYVPENGNPSHAGIYFPGEGKNRAYALKLRSICQAEDIV